jgi:hypothetical protein
MRAAHVSIWANIKGTGPSSRPTAKSKRAFDAAHKAALVAAAKARLAKATKAGRLKLELLGSGLIGGG